MLRSCSLTRTIGSLVSRLLLLGGSSLRAATLADNSRRLSKARVVRNPQTGTVGTFLFRPGAAVVVVVVVANLDLAAICIAERLFPEAIIGFVVPSPDKPRAAFFDLLLLDPTPLAIREVGNLMLRRILCDRSCV